MINFVAVFRCSIVSGFIGHHELPDSWLHAGNGRAFDPLVVLASIHKERCTALYGVPTMFIAELHHPMFDLFDMSCLRTGIMAGSLCPVELMKQVEEKMYMKVTSVYG